MLRDHGNPIRGERLMYQLIPLLLALAFLMPWVGPADPGDRMAAANAADGLAEQGLIFHQGVLAYVRANPGANGEVVPVALPTRWTTLAAAACAKSGMVMTYLAVPVTVSKPAVAEAMGRLWGGFPLVGQAHANKLTNPFTGLSMTLPCAVDDYSPVIVSQAGG
jgi:hypothetical protein